MEWRCGRATIDDVLAFRPRTRTATSPADAAVDGWRAEAAAYAVAVREEAMVLEPGRWGLVTDLGELAARLPPSLRRGVTARDDGAALRITTGLHPTVGAAMSELGALRGRLTAALGRDGLRIAAAGAHPEHDVTFGLEVAVAIPDGHRAATAHDRMRAHLPLLLARSANAPFLDGGETGLATARGASLEDPSQDLQLDPDRGALTVAILDAQTQLRDVAALTALVQCLTRLEATRRTHRHDRRVRLETVVTGRARAARHGMAAHLDDDRPAREVVAGVLAECTPHARTMQCLQQLEGIHHLAAAPGDTRQRASARLRPGEPSGGRRLRTLTAALSAAYSAT
jgi:carboxylate-amine ligase